MSFMYLFDMVEFDKKGKVCETKSLDLQHSQSNYLYLVSKYNQAFLQDAGMSIPSFFKENLNELLVSVENGEDFSKAEKKVLSNCMPEVKAMAKSSESEQEFISKLNERVSVKDKVFLESLKNVGNDKHLKYVLTFCSGRLFETASIKALKADIHTDPKEKSKLFKDIINYNSLVRTADKVEEKLCSVSDVIRRVVSC